MNIAAKQYQDNDTILNRFHDPIQCSKKSDSAANKYVQRQRRLPSSISPLFTLKRRENRDCKAYQQNP